MYHEIYERRFEDGCKREVTLKIIKQSLERYSWFFLQGGHMQLDKDGFLIL
jgi:hypothetical protein